MKWVTRENAKVDRVACPWLIRRFIDPDAEFLFVPAEEVMAVADREAAAPYDVPGVELGHVDGRCSFESLMLKYGLSGDPALVVLAKIVHAADVAANIDSVPEGRGLKAIAHGFALLLGRDDARKIELETPVYEHSTPGVSNSRRPLVRASDPWRRAAVSEGEVTPRLAGVVEPPCTTPAGTAHLPAIEVRGVGRRDPKGDAWLIRDVSFTVHPGDRLAVLGPSGSGKTVLLRAMAMLDPLDAGSIAWRGHLVLGCEVPSYRKQVIYLHQRPALLDGSVEDNLRHLFTLKAHKDRRFDRERLLELLNGLDRDAAFLGKSSRDLSGGEAQIVALVRAIQLDPVVLLVDEPTASLDQTTARSVERLLDRWLAAGNGGRALVWVSHDLDQARRVTGRALHLKSRRLDPEG